MSDIDSGNLKRRRIGKFERGDVNILLIPFILAIVVFIAAAGFGFWAFSEREDYRLNTEQKIADAVVVAKKEEGTKKDREHAEADKQPLKIYSGPEQFGSIQVAFPKTWSGYVNTGQGSGQPLDGYFHPMVVPSTSDQQQTFALRAQVIAQPYATVLNQFQPYVLNKTLTATAFSFPKIPNVVGIRYDGNINASKKITGSMVIVPLRDKTLQVWTESPVYYPEFNNYILPNLTFSP